MASFRFEKYRKKASDQNNNITNMNSEMTKLSSFEGTTRQSPQERVRDWFTCICLRPSSHILCCNVNCRYQTFGRVRKVCRMHPKVTYLMDLVVCPNCLGNAVIEITQDQYESLFKNK